MHIKRKKKKSELPENILQWRKNFLLNKRRALRDKQKRLIQKDRDDIFNRRMKSINNPKALVTLRTKSFYRFSEFYPSIVNPEGFRENNENQRNRRLGVMFTLTVCLLVFFLSYIFAKTGVLLANIQPSQTQTAQASVEAEPYNRAYHLDYETLLNVRADEIVETLNNYHCNAALVELKNEYGYVFFNTGSFYGQSADKRIDNVMDTVNALKNQGFEVWASICCYKDSCAPQADLSLAVRKNTSEGGAWYDNHNNAYLNPFSETAEDYLLSLVAFADESGFDRIVLTDVAFPSDSGTATAYFPGESEADKSRNEILTSFINTAVKSTQHAAVTVLGNTNAFEINNNEDTKGTHGNLLNTSADALCIDVRFSLCTKNIQIGDRLFKNPTSLPYVFTLTAGEYLKNVTSDEHGKSTAKAFVCIERDDYFRQSYEGVLYSQCDGYILW